jgi:GPH family glycoside/pentoside/hexuronide:cation symporter
MQQAVTPPSRILSLPIKLAYGFGSIAYGIKDNGFSTLLLLYYNQVVGLPASLVGLAIMVALVLDAAIDPMVGHFSDHLQSRWGRRHPFMYASALPVAGLYLLLWHPPIGASHTLILLFLVTIAILVRTAISFYEIPSAALAPELTADYHERTSVLGYRYLFGWIGGIGMLLLTFGYFLVPTARFPIGQLNPEGYHRYAIVASCLMAAAILLSAFGTHGEIRNLPTAVIERQNVRETFAGIAATLRHRPFVILMIAGVFSFTAQGLSFALSTYFNTFLWGLPASVLGVFALCVILGVVAAFMLAATASKRWGKRRPAVCFGLAYIPVSLAPLVLRLVGWFPHNGSPWLIPLLIASGTVGTALGVGVSILGASMMSDVVEDAQARTGQRSEGLFFAGSFFMQKCVSGLGLFLSGAVLSLVHFPDHATPATVSHAVLTHLVVTYCAMASGLTLVAAWVLSRFPLSEAGHRHRLDELAEAVSHATPLPGGDVEFPPLAYITPR